MMIQFLGLENNESTYVDTRGLVCEKIFARTCAISRVFYLGYYLLLLPTTELRLKDYL